MALCLQMCQVVESAVGAALPRLELAMEEAESAGFTIDRGSYVNDIDAFVGQVLPNLRTRIRYFYKTGNLSLRKRYNTSELHVLETFLLEAWELAVSNNYRYGRGPFGLLMLKSACWKIETEEWVRDLQRWPQSRQRRKS